LEKENRYAWYLKKRGKRKQKGPLLLVTNHRGGNFFTPGKKGEGRAIAEGGRVSHAASLDAKRKERKRNLKKKKDVKIAHIGEQI